MNDYEKSQRIEHALDRNTSPLTKCYLCAYYYAGGCTGKEDCTEGIKFFIRGEAVKPVRELKEVEE